MSQQPSDQVFTALAFVDKAIQERRVSPSVRQAAEAFLFLVEEFGFQVSAVDGYHYRNEASVSFAKGDDVVSIGWSDVDPVAVHLWRGLRGVGLRRLLPPAEHAAYDKICDEQDFSQLAGFVKRWAGQLLRGESGGSSGLERPEQ